MEPPPPLPLPEVGGGREYRYPASFMAVALSSNLGFVLSVGSTRTSFKVEALRRLEAGEQLAEVAGERGFTSVRPIHS